LNCDWPMGSIGRRTTLILREVERICANGNGTENSEFHECRSFFNESLRKQYVDA
jgi:hypothetical protein